MSFKTRVLDARLLAEPLVPATPGSAGLDLRNCSGGPVFLPPDGSVVMVGTGLAVHLDDPTKVGLVTLRSGTAKRGARLANQIGVIDSDYQGEIILALQNTSYHALSIQDLERVAQLIIVDCHPFVPDIVDEFDYETGRGSGGFGSTGAK